MYGTSLISRSKDGRERTNSKKKNNSKNYELTDIYEKAYMNRTISPYQNNGRRKLKSQRIGIDKGFGENFMKTSDPGQAAIEFIQEFRRLMGEQQTGISGHGN